MSTRTMLSAASAKLGYTPIPVAAMIQSPRQPALWFSTVVYIGTPMMSDTYDKEKWKTAMDAVQEAITFAEQNGHKLYEDPASVNLPDAQRGRNNYYNCFLQPWNRDEYLFAVAEQAYATRYQQ